MGNGASFVVDNFLNIEPSHDPTDFVAKKLSHGCNLFVQDAEARAAFINFIKGASWVDKLNDEPTSQEIAKETTGITLPTINSHSNTKVQDLKLGGTKPKTYANYEMPNNNSSYEIIRNRLGNEEQSSRQIHEHQPRHRHHGGKAKNSDESKAERMAAVIETCFTVSQMKTVLLASLFPLFLESPEYTALIEQYTMDNSSLSSAGALQPTTTGNTKNQTKFADMTHDHTNSTISPTGMIVGDDGKEHDERLADIYVGRPRRLKDLVSSTLKSVDDQELQFMLRTGNWLHDLIVAVEELPLCVTLATAREERRGFPLVYVNKTFERVTGYDRKEIVGRNCRFLQSRKTEMEQIRKLQYALRCALPVKVALTNVRKDGEEFINLLAMKPIFDSHGVYSYVVGVQYDITLTGASLRELNMVNDLLNILPNVLK